MTIRQESDKTNEDGRHKRDYSFTKMLCANKRIVVFLGAGFPTPWGAPNSTVLGKLVTEEIINSPFAFLAERCSNQFEHILAALYSYAVFPANNTLHKLFQPLIPAEIELNGAMAVYLRCINKVMGVVNEYEQKCTDENNETINRNLRSLFCY